MSPNPLQLIHRVRRSIWTWPLAVLAALLFMSVNETAYQRSTAALGRLGERAMAWSQIQLVWRSLLDAETGQRGYLLTGRSDYLEPYQRATGEVHGALSWLARYYLDDAQAQPLLAELQSLSEGKLSELATTLELRERGAPGVWRELLLTDIGREKMDSVRQTVSQLLAVETGRVSDERRAADATLAKARLAMHGMTLLSLLALFLFLRQTQAFDQAQQQHAVAMQVERDRLEDEAERRTADLTELTRHLQTAREDERFRLARELHDELGALLTAAKLDAARLKRAIGELSPDVQARLLHLNESINRGIELKRRIIEDLRPSSLNNLGLVAALEILARDHAARNEVALELQLEPVEFGDGGQITVYRLVQEALTNIAKYAQARSVTIALQRMPSGGRDGARVSVRDDGRGFDPGTRPGTAHGLMGMQYRVEAEGGRMQVQSKPGAGTVIEAWLPLTVQDPGVSEPVALAG